MDYESSHNNINILESSLDQIDSGVINVLNVELHREINE